MPDTQPAVLQAGDTLTWAVDLPDHPADQGWVLSYRLINAGARIDIVAAPDPAQPARHRVTVPAATSAGYVPGSYTAVRYVTRGTDRHTLAQGDMRILPDLAAVPGNLDARSEARRALDDLRAALMRWLASNGHVAEYDIAGRRMRFATADDIKQRIQLAEAEVAREAAADRLAAGLGGRRKVLVRF